MPLLAPAVGIEMMPEGNALPGGALHSHHDPGLVILAIAVAMASFVALNLAGRIRETRGGPRVGGWFAGAMAMGGGVGRCISSPCLPSRSGRRSPMTLRPRCCRW